MQRCLALAAAACANAPAWFPDGVAAKMKHAPVRAKKN